MSAVSISLRESPMEQLEYEVGLWEGAGYPRADLAVRMGSVRFADLYRDNWFGASDIYGFARGLQEVAGIRVISDHQLRRVERQVVEDVPLIASPDEMPLMEDSTITTETIERPIGELPDNQLVTTRYADQIHLPDIDTPWRSWNV